MKIKRLEIVGFKSFVDKTVVKFDGGITAILGPNGCGKSNVVDAIQWASGEQRPKQLRGKEMADVIFAGSESRQPTGMAEVTITFANDGSVSHEYQAYTEIQVTRRLYRSGESEYLLNKTPCRLRDIQELLMDAGVGRGSVSVVQQGKVGLIVSSAPGERRSIIEEAAGISKYKAKKRQATLKMEATAQNLLRVKDILAELERQIRYLDRQAKKAARYRRLKEEMRELDLKVHARDFTQLTAELDGVRQTTEARRQDEAGVAGELAAAEAKIEAHRVELDEEDKRLAATSESLVTLNADIQRQEQQLTYDRTRANELAERAASAAQDSKAARREAQSLTAELARMKKELEEADHGVDGLDGRLAEATQGLEDGKAKHAEIMQHVEMLKGRVIDAMQQIANGNNQIAALERRKRELDVRMERGTAEQDQVGSAVRKLERERASTGNKLGELKQLRFNLTESAGREHSALEELRTQRTNAEETLARLREEFAGERSRLESLQELQKKFEGYSQGVRAVMTARDAVHPQAGVRPQFLAGIRGIVADQLEVPARLEAAIEAVLGPRLQMVLVSSSQDALSSIEFLKGSESGRGSFLPADARVPTRPDRIPAHAKVLGCAAELITVKGPDNRIADVLLANVLVVEDIETAVAVYQSGAAGWTIVTVDGDVVDGTGAMTGGTSQDGAGLLARRRKIDELASRVAALKTEVAAREQDFGKLVKRIAAAEQSHQKLLKDAQDEELRIVGQEKDLQALATQLEREKERLDEISFEVMQTQTGLDEVSRETAEARRLVETGERGKLESDLALSAAEESLEQAVAHVETLTGELTKLKVDVASLRERRDGLTEAFERVRRSSEEMSTRIERLVKDSEDATGDRARLISGAEVATEDLARKTEQAREQTRLLTADREAFDARMRQVREREGGLKGNRETLDGVRQQLSELGMKETELSMRIRHLVDGAAEKYGEDLSASAEAWMDAELDDATAEERLTYLRDRLSKLGEVNVAAIEEYAEVTERQAFLSQQRDDLEDSLGQLRDAIRKINKTTRQRFLETFEAVNARFQEIFPRMFRGGRAALILTDPMDPLETGIDIVAQPPGKKLQNINLLSGGEKALTAVSLIIGIFLVRPTPFCLLDEVDAPLDDANVGRFNEIVREMSQNSQFILITHNKGTMGIAKNLYGVTMEEPGVSKIVNVKFDGGKVA